MRIPSSIFIAVACGAIALSGCDGMPPSDGEPAASVSTPAAGGGVSPGRPGAKSAEERIAALESEVAELKRLLKNVAADGAGNLTISANLRVNGAMGINAAPTTGFGLTVLGSAVGAKISGPTAVMARGTGSASVGVDSDGAANGVLATSKNIGVASAGGDYSFYGFEGILRNDGNAVVRGTERVRTDVSSRAPVRMTNELFERRMLLAPAVNTDLIALPEVGEAALPSVHALP